MRKNTTLIFVTLFVSVLAAFPAVFAEEGVNADDASPFIHGATSDPSGFDPLGVYDTTSGLVILNTLEGLFAFDWESLESEVIPMLAVDEGTWNTNLTEWTIELRDDVTWWNGEAFTAEHVKWNFDRLNTLSAAGLCNHASLWFNDEGDLILNSTTVVDAHTIKFTLNKAWLDWEKLLPFWGCSMIYPDEDYADAIIDIADFDKVIGTGPFMIDSYTAGETTVLTRYNDYWQGAASIPKLIIQIFADGTTMADALLNDEIYTLRAIPFDKWQEALDDTNIGVEVVEGSCIYYFHMSDQVAYDVRRAMQFAYNYTYNEQEYFRGIGTQTSHPIPIGMEGYNADLAGLPYYDLAVARAFILDSEDADIIAAVAANSLTATSTDSEWRAAAEGDNPIGHYNFTSYGTGLYTQFADNAKDVGVLIDHDIVGDWPTFLDYADEYGPSGEMQFSYGGWCPDYYDPVNMLEPLFATNASSNWNGLQNETIDDNLAALHTLSGAEKQAAVDEVVTQIIMEQAHAMYYIQSADLFAWNSEVIVDGIDSFFNVRGDKYFYALTYVAPSPTIPAYPVAMVLVGLLGISAFLVIRNRK